MTSAHTHQEAVSALALAIVGLESALHVRYLVELLTGSGREFELAGKAGQIERSESPTLAHRLALVKSVGCLYRLR